MTNLEALAMQQRLSMQRQQMAHMNNLQQAQMMNCGIYAGLGGAGALMAGIGSASPVKSSEVGEDLKLTRKISTSRSGGLTYDFDCYMYEIDKEIGCE